MNKALTGKWLQLYWPDDGKWWPGQVASVDTRKKAITFLYETGAFSFATGCFEARLEGKKCL